MATGLFHVSFEPCIVIDSGKVPPNFLSISSVFNRDRLFLGRSSNSREFQLSLKIDATENIISTTDPTSICFLNLKMIRLQNAFLKTNSLAEYVERQQPMEPSSIESISSLKIQNQRLQNRIF